MTEKTLYFDNVLSAFNNGAIMDLRLKLAMDLLKSTMFSDRFVENEEGCAFMASQALSIANALFKQAAEQGLIQPLPTGEELGDDLREQAKRLAAFSVLQQLAGQEIANAEKSRVTIPHTHVPGQRINGG